MCWCLSIIELLLELTTQPKPVRVLLFGILTSPILKYQVVSRCTIFIVLSLKPDLISTYCC